MGFMDWLTGANRERLVEMPTSFERVEVPALHVHTANLSPDTDEKIVILTTTPVVLEELRAMRGAVQFVAADERAVTFVPSKSASAPVLDPKQGWIIPVSPATARELQSLPAGPGEYELESIHVGLVLE